MTRVGERWREHPVDLAVPVVTAALAVSTAWLSAVRDRDPAPSAAAILVLVLGAAVTVDRRRRPVAVWAATVVISVGYGVADWPDPILPFSALVALAAVFEFADRRWRLPVLAMSALVAVATTALTSDSDALDWWSAVFVLVAAPLAGAYLAARQALVEELEARARAAEARERAETEQARAAERARIARELHDVVAHHVTMLVIQAEAAASAATMTDAERRSALDELADTGRGALTELRQLLAVLRSDDPPLTAPQPGLARLDDVVAGVRGAGLPLTVRCRGEVAQLPAAVDLAGYRVVQEALTNVMRYAPQAPTELTVDATGHELAITVVNRRSPARPVGTTSTGVGLIGLRERVELLSGSLTAGFTDDGGYRLRAVIPVDGR